MNDNIERPRNCGECARFIPDRDDLQKATVTNGRALYRRTAFVIRTSAGSGKRGEVMESGTIEERPGQVTEWMRRDGACGPTGYPNCRLNIMWCTAEVERLRAKGVRAVIRENDKGEIAVFREDER